MVASEQVVLRCCVLFKVNTGTSRGLQGVKWMVEIAILYAKDQTEAKSVYRIEF